MRLLLNPDLSHSPSDFRTACALFTLCIMFHSWSCQLRILFRTASSHLRPRSPSMENWSMRSPRFWTPSSTDDVPANSYIWSDGPDTKAPTKKHLGCPPPNSDMLRSLFRTSMLLIPLNLVPCR